MHIISSAFTNALNIGVTPTFKIKDQLEKIHPIKADTKTIIVDSDKEASVVIRD